MIAWFEEGSSTGRELVACLLQREPLDLVVQALVREVGRSGAELLTRGRGGRVVHRNVPRSLAPSR